MMDLVIFGAQGYALGAYEALRSLYPKRVIRCFVVSLMGNNASTLGNIPVRELNVFADELTSDEKKNIEVLIATPENVQPEVEELLENYGFHYHRRLNSERWSELMKLFHIRRGRFLPLAALPVGCNRPFVRIYVAKSHMDRPLKNMVSLSDYSFPIQVGAANCDERISDLGDNEGENISSKNANYSELTGLYWIWKNKMLTGGALDDEKKQYYGLAQYRRRLVFSDDDILRLADNDVDVVLPYPMPYEPNINVHHERYLKDVDWKALLRAIQELQPGYADAFPVILGQQFLYNYNVIMARKYVLRDYCEWLFPILERIEELSEPRGCERGDRYIGYMGEILETLYFIKNADNLNVVHTGCKLFV